MNAASTAATAAFRAYQRSLASVRSGALPCLPHFGSQPRGGLPRPRARTTATAATVEMQTGRDAARRMEPRHAGSFTATAWIVAFRGSQALLLDPRQDHDPPQDSKQQDRQNSRRRKHVQRDGEPLRYHATPHRHAGRLRVFAYVLRFVPNLTPTFAHIPFPRG